MKLSKKQWQGLLALLYALLMLYLLFLQRQPRRLELSYRDCLRSGLELELFRATRRYLYIARSDLSTALVYLGGNVLCFVPLGVFLSMGGRRFWPMLGLAFGLILGVELLQYFSTLGYFDIDDLVSNLLGVLLGRLLWRLWPRSQKP